MLGVREDTYEEAPRQTGETIKKVWGRSTWLAQWEERATLDLQVMSSRPTVGADITRY